MQRGSAIHKASPIHVSMEAMFRPWIPVDSFIQPRPVPAPIEQLPVAFVRIGDATRFEFDASFRPKALSFSGVGVAKGKTGNQPNLLTYDEISRKTTTVRVTNPTDPEQYVDVERVDVATFRNADGTHSQFKFRNG